MCFRTTLLDQLKLDGQLATALFSNVFPNRLDVSPHPLPLSAEELYVHHHNHDGHSESAQRWHVGCPQEE